MKLWQIIKGWTLWVWYYLNKAYRDSRKSDALKRIEICEKCELFNVVSRTCDVCGCFMDIKTKLEFPVNEKGISIGGCPEKKW